MKSQIEQVGAEIGGDPGSANTPARADTGSSVDLRLLKHDLKNQVTTILCFCSLLRQSFADLRPKQVDYIDQIQASTKGILLLLNGLGGGSHSTDPGVQNRPDPAVTD